MTSSVSTDFLVLWWGLCNPGLNSCGFLFLLSFPTWAVWMEHPYPPTPRVSESWTLYWVESGCAFNICWKSETSHSIRAYKKLSGSSLAQAAEELMAPFLCGFSISGWLSTQTHLLFRACSFARVLRSLQPSRALSTGGLGLMEWCAVKQSLACFRPSDLGSSQLDVKPNCLMDA